MVVKSDQEHVRALLTEAITVLCKNRLNYKAQLNIEGLIGITLDTDDIFLVNIKETVIKEEDEGVEFIDKLMSNTVNHSRQGRQRKSTPRHLSVVTSPSIYQDPDDQECTWQLADGTDIEDLSPLDLVQLSSQKHYTPNHKPVENGIDAPLNLSHPSSKDFKDNDPKERQHDDLPENLAPQKRKRLKREDTESVSSATNSKRSCFSNASSPSPVMYSPVPPMVTIKQEPLTPGSGNAMSTDAHTNGILLIQPTTGLTHHAAVPSKANSPPLADRDKRMMPGRNNHLESIIWQRLSAAVNPIHMSTPLIPSQECEDSIMNNNSRAESPSDNQEKPVLKVPLYSITGKLKKEKAERAPSKENGTTKEKLPIKESNTSNTDNMIIRENFSRNDKIINLDIKPLKRIESKFMNNGPADLDSIDKLDHCYAEKGLELHIDTSHNSSSDGYHSLQGDSTDQENIEVLSIDSDDDVKTEDFIERSQEPGKAVSYKCKLCDRVYSNKWNCRRHIQYTHMNKTGFTCEICHNKYRDRSDYQEHMMVIHQGPGGYKCDFCDKILMSKRSLKEHVSLHTGQYRYHCMECSRGFNRLNDYQLHMTKDHSTKIANMSGPEIAQFIDDSQKAVLPEAIIP